MKAIRNGFTLIELLVVVTIIAVLAAIGLATYTQAQKIARDSRRMADIKAVQSAAEIYKTQIGSYPKDAAVLAGRMEGGVFPTDPKSGSAYDYRANKYTLNSRQACLPEGRITYTIDAGYGCETDGLCTCYTVCAVLEQQGKGNAITTYGSTPGDSGVSPNLYCAGAKQ